jgi:hypothetical protein
MKRALMILLIVSLAFYGCTTGNSTAEKNLSKGDAETLAVQKVYDLTKNKDVYKDGFPRAAQSTFNANKDRWDIEVLTTNSTLVKAYVYNNGTVKVSPTTYFIKYTQTEQQHNQTEDDGFNISDITGQ